MNAHVNDLFHDVADLSPEARNQYFATHDVDAETRIAVEELLAFDSGSSALLGGTSAPLPARRSRNSKSPSSDADRTVC
jgi:hypothetical protein